MAIDMTYEPFRLAFLFIVSCSLFWTLPASAQQRTWTDDTGNNRVDAELIIIEKAVRLKKKNGVVVTVPFSRLSAADIAYLERLESDSPSAAQGKTSSPNKNGLTADKNASEAPPSNPANEVIGEIKPETIAKSGPPTAGGTAAEQPVGTIPVAKSPAVNRSQPASRQTANRNSAAISDARNETSVATKNEAKRLSESELAEMRSTIDKLKTSWPDDPSPELMEKLASYAESSDKSIRSSALALLGEHDPAENLDLIIQRLDDSSFEIRWQAYDILETLGDARAIDPLLARFSGKDCSKIASVLEIFGPEIEPRIIPFLSDPSVDVRLSACDLLGSIGTTESVPTLEEMRENAIELAVRMQAQSALREIASRN